MLMFMDFALIVEQDKSSALLAIVHVFRSGQIEFTPLLSAIHDLSLSGISQPTGDVAG